jgi:flavin-dependent dehydrogenase
MLEEIVDVIIIGAGVVGLTLAHALEKVTLARLLPLPFKILTSDRKGSPIEFLSGMTV